MSSFKDPITIVECLIKNFRRLSVAELRIDKDRGLVRVTGGNRQGKTSVLSAIAATLGGAKAVPENAMHDGDEFGDEAVSFTRLMLSNGFIVERRYSASNPKGKLVITGVDGGTHSQSRLNEWLGERSADPLAFFELDDKKRTKLLLSLGNDPELPDKLDALRERRQKLYDERTPHIVAVRAAKAVPAPEGVRPEPVDISASMDQLAELRKQQRERDLVVRETEEINREIDLTTRSIDDLKRALAQARAALEAHEAQYEQTLERLQSMPDRTDTIDAIEAHIADADAVAKQCEPWREYDKAQQALELETDAVEVLTRELAAVDDEFSALLAAADIPVQGLTVSHEGEPLINGRPFSAASGEERMSLAVDVAMAAKPKLRVILLDEANDLDLNALERLEQRARESGFQVWVCRIGLESPGDVVVEDGVARTNGPAEVAA